MPADFVDTNLLVYYARRERPKSEQVRVLIENGCTISVQIMNEFVNVCRRKLRLDWIEIDSWLRLLDDAAEVKDVTLADHRLGVALAQRHRFATYDAMIVASALNAGCATLWSEDMQDGLVVEGALRIRNPFAPEGD